MWLIVVGKLELPVKKEGELPVPAARDDVDGYRVAGDFEVGTPFGPARLGYDSRKKK